MESTNELCVKKFFYGWDHDEITNDSADNFCVGWWVEEVLSGGSGGRGYDNINSGGLFPILERFSYLENYSLYGLFPEIEDL